MKYMFREMCETPELLQSIYTAKLFLQIICIVVPFIIMYAIIKDLVGVLIKGEKMSMTFAQAAKRIVAGLVVFLIPTIVYSALDLVGDTDAFYHLNLCNQNATPENIDYFKSVATAERIITALETNTTEENLERAREALESIQSFARGETMMDFQMRITKAEQKVDEQKKIQDCKGQQGTWKDGYCYIPEDLQKLRKERRTDGQDGSASLGDLDGATSESGTYNFTGGDGELVDYDGEYDVVQAGISLKNFVSAMRSKGIYQGANPEKYNDKCLSFAYFHAYALYTGDTSGNGDTGMSYTRAGQFSGYDNDDKQAILKIVYNELQTGKPVVIQVNGNKAGTSRHYVTVVGVKKGVTASTIQETDLLIFDSYQGTVRKIDGQPGSRFLVTGAACHKKYSGYQIYYLKQGKKS